MKKAIICCFLTLAFISVTFCSGMFKSPTKVLWEKAFKNSVDDFVFSLRMHDKFILRSDYPRQPINENRGSWKKYNFKCTVEYKSYMNEVLQYFLLQNVKGIKKEDWFKQKGKNSNIWYHAPGLSWESKKNLGREYINGLTRERSMRKEDWKISTIVDSSTNWAVGFYNPTAAFTIGQTWNRERQEILQSASFDENSVIVKLLYTASSEKELPLVKGSITVDANIILSKKDTIKMRRVKPVHLIQIDFAVKDNRSEYGWVFGTFVFKGSDEGISSINDFDKFIPLGVNWGPNPTESLLNKDAARYFESYWFINEDHRVNRLRGPIDNPRVENCMKCHSEIEVGNDLYQSHNYDYSLQLAKGIQAFNKKLYLTKGDMKKFNEVELNKVLLTIKDNFNPSFTSED